MISLVLEPLYKIGALVLHSFENVSIICNVHNNDIIGIVTHNQNWNTSIACI
jgi:hypothetical protein